jgi:HPr kinase/phosphorylase
MELVGPFQGQLHASCVERAGAGVLLLGGPGSGKSDLTLRLIDHGFSLVADDRVDIADGFARAPVALAGLLEVRGLGIVRIPYTAKAALALAIELDGVGERVPCPRRHKLLDLPLIALDPSCVSAASRVAMALACALGQAEQVVGAFVT